MSGKLPAIAATLVISALAAAAFAQTPAPSNDTNLPAGTRYLPQYTASGELILPKDYREWVFVGSPLTPNALNSGHAAFPEYHNVYIDPGSYAIYKKTGVFPEGTIFYKELQLTLKPEENPDGSRTEPSGRGFFPGVLAGAEVSVKDTKRFAASGGWVISTLVIRSQSLPPHPSERSRNAPLATLTAPSETSSGPSTIKYSMKFRCLRARRMTWKQAVSSIDTASLGWPRCDPTTQKVRHPMAGSDQWLGSLQ